MFLIRNEEEIHQLDQLLEGILNKNQTLLETAENPELLIYLFRRFGKKPIRLLKQLLIEEHGLNETADAKEGLAPLLLILDQRFKQTLPPPLQELGTDGLTTDALRVLAMFVLCFYQLEWKRELGQEWLVLELDEANHVYCDQDYSDLLLDYQSLF